MASWTNPYHGLQHLCGLKRGYQISITTYSDTLTTAFAIVPGSGFSSVAEGSFESAELARAWGEKTAAELGAAAS